MRSLADSVFEPGELQTLRGVFDNTWNEIELQVCGDQDALRDELGALILGLACDRQLGEQQLQQTAARLMRERHGRAPNTDVLPVMDVAN
jgi:hypothetical protein